MSELTSVEAMAAIQDLLEDKDTKIEQIRAVCDAFFEGRREQKRCKYCDVPFLVGTGTGMRSTKEFCSDKHRTYWRRQELRKDSNILDDGHPR